MDVDIASERLQASNILDNVYTTYVILEGESSAEMQASVGNNYGKLQFALNNFQNIPKNKTCKWQATLTIFKIT